MTDEQKKKGLSLPIKPEDLDKTADNHEVIQKRQADNYIKDLTLANHKRLMMISEKTGESFKSLFNKVIDTYNSEPDIVHSNDETKVKVNKACELLLIKFSRKKTKKEEEEESPPKSQEQQESLRKFKDPNLMINIRDEISKKHLKNDKEKLLTFVEMLTSRLPPADRVSGKIRGSSSTGKTNMVNACAEHIPESWYNYTSRITVASLEDDIKEKDLLIILEKQGDPAVNETLKQVMEDGMDIWKHDKDTNEQTYSGHVPRKTVIDTSTTNETDDEVANRALITYIDEDVERFQKVIDTYQESQDNLEKVIERARELKETKDSWIKQGLEQLETFDEIWIPGFKALPIEVKSKSEGRLQRDTKKFLGLAKAIAWLNQKNRRQLVLDGVRILVGQIEDICWTQYLSSESFVYSISGVSSKIEKLLVTIDELVKEGVTESVSNDTKLWVRRRDAQDKLEILATSTMQKLVDEAYNLGLVKVYQSYQESPMLIRRTGTVKKRPLISYKWAIIYKIMKPVQDKLFYTQFIPDLYMNYSEINTGFNTCLPDKDEDNQPIKNEEKFTPPTNIDTILDGFDYEHLIEYVKSKFIAEINSHFESKIGPPVRRPDIKSVK